MKSFSMDNKQNDKTLLMRDSSNRTEIKPDAELTNPEKVKKSQTDVQLNMKKKAISFISDEVIIENKMVPNFIEKPLEISKFKNRAELKEYKKEIIENELNYNLHTINDEVKIKCGNKKLLNLSDGGYQRNYVDNENDCNNNESFCENKEKNVSKLVIQDTNKRILKEEDKINVLKFGTRDSCDNEMATQKACEIKPVDIEFKNKIECLNFNNNENSPLILHSAKNSNDEKKIFTLKVKSEESDIYNLQGINDIPRKKDIYTNLFQNHLHSPSIPINNKDMPVSSNNQSNYKSGPITNQYGSINFLGVDKNVENKLYLNIEEIRGMQREENLNTESELEILDLRSENEIKYLEDNESGYSDDKFITITKDFQLGKNDLKVDGEKIVKLENNGNGEIEEEKNIKLKNNIKIPKDSISTKLRLENMKDILINDAKGRIMKETVEENSLENSEENDNKIEDKNTTKSNVYNKTVYNSDQSSLFQTKSFLERTFEVFPIHNDYKKLDEPSEIDDFFISDAKKPADLNVENNDLFVLNTNKNSITDQSNLIDRNDNFVIPKTDSISNSNINQLTDTKVKESTNLSGNQNFISNPDQFSFFNQNNLKTQKDDFFISNESQFSIFSQNSTQTKQDNLFNTNLSQCSNSDHNNMIKSNTDILISIDTIKNELTSFRNKTQEKQTTNNFFENTKNSNCNISEIGQNNLNEKICKYPAIVSELKIKDSSKNEIELQEKKFEIFPGKNFTFFETKDFFTERGTNKEMKSIKSETMQEPFDDFEDTVFGNGTRQKNSEKSEKESLDDIFNDSKQQDIDEIAGISSDNYIKNKTEQIINEIFRDEEEINNIPEIYNDSCTENKTEEILDDIFGDDDEKEENENNFLGTFDNNHTKNKNEQIINDIFGEEANLKYKKNEKTIKLNSDDLFFTKDNDSNYLFNDKKNQSSLFDKKDLMNVNEDENLNINNNSETVEIDNLLDEEFKYLEDEEKTDSKRIKKINSGKIKKESPTAKSKSLSIEEKIMYSKEISELIRKKSINNRINTANTFLGVKNRFAKFEEQTDVVNVDINGFDSIDLTDGFRNHTENNNEDQSLITNKQNDKLHDYYIDDKIENSFLNGKITFYDELDDKSKIDSMNDSNKIFDKPDQRSHVDYVKQNPHVDFSNLNYNYPQHFSHNIQEQYNKNLYDQYISSQPKPKKNVPNQNRENHRNSFTNNSVKYTNYPSSNIKAIDTFNSQNSHGQNNIRTPENFNHQQRSYANNYNPQNINSSDMYKSNLQIQNLNNPNFYKTNLQPQNINQNNFFTKNQNSNQFQIKIPFNSQKMDFNQKNMKSNQNKNKRSQSMERKPLESDNVQYAQTRSIQNTNPSFINNVQQTNGVVHEKLNNVNDFGYNNMFQNGQNSQGFAQARTPMNNLRKFSEYEPLNYNFNNTNYNFANNFRGNKNMGGKQNKRNNKDANHINTNLESNNKNKYENVTRNTEHFGYQQNMNINPSMNNNPNVNNTPNFQNMNGNYSTVNNQNMNINPNFQNINGNPNFQNMNSMNNMQNLRNMNANHNAGMNFQNNAYISNQTPRQSARPEMYNINNYNGSINPKININRHASPYSDQNINKTQTLRQFNYYTNDPNMNQNEQYMNLNNFHNQNPNVRNNDNLININKNYFGSKNGSPENRKPISDNNANKNQASHVKNVFNGISNNPNISFNIRNNNEEKIITNPPINENSSKRRKPSNDNLNSVFINTNNALLQEKQRSSYSGKKNDNKVFPSIHERVVSNSLFDNKSTNMSINNLNNICPIKEFMKENNITDLNLTLEEKVFIKTRLGQKKNAFEEFELFFNKFPKNINKDDKYMQAYNVYRTLVMQRDAIEKQIAFIKYENLEGLFQYVKTYKETFEKSIKKENDVNFDNKINGSTWAIKQIRANFDNLKKQNSNYMVNYGDDEYNMDDNWNAMFDLNKKNDDM